MSEEYLPEHAMDYVPVVPEKKGSLLSNKAYDAAKWIALVFLPAIGTAYFGLAQIWGLPKPEEVLGSLVITETFIGSLVGISSAAYHKSGADTDGIMTVNTSDPEKDVYNMILTKPIDDLPSQDKVTFKVQDITDSQ